MGDSPSTGEGHESPPTPVPEPLRPLFGTWDDPRPQAECLHCRGTGLAPSGDGRTPCGFCLQSA